MRRLDPHRLRLDKGLTFSKYKTTFNVQMKTKHFCFMKKEDNAKKNDTNKKKRGRLRLSRRRKRSGRKKMNQKFIIIIIRGRSVT